MEKIPMFDIEHTAEKRTPCENVTHFECTNGEITAVFDSEKSCIKYIRKYSPIKYTKKWSDVVGFANFHRVGNKIVAKSTYHPPICMKDMFLFGLRFSDRDLKEFNRKVNKAAKKQNP